MGTFTEVSGVKDTSVQAMPEIIAAALSVFCYFDQPSPYHSSTVSGISHKQQKHKAVMVMMPCC